MIAIFTVLRAYGLGIGLIYALNLELSSDTVVPGLVAREIFDHGNFQFDFPVNDPTFSPISTHSTCCHSTFLAMTRWS